MARVLAVGAAQGLVQDAVCPRGDALQVVVLRKGHQLEGGQEVNGLLVKALQRPGAGGGCTGVDALDEDHQQGEGELNDRRGALARRGGMGLKAGAGPLARRGGMSLMVGAGHSQGEGA